ncbi:MAG: HD domain-containing protein [Myxococcota bacterium]
MKPDEADFVAAALRFALERHAGQTRKGRPEVPYASHLLRVAGLVMEHGGDPRQVAVALLHDVIEDCGVTDAELEERFGADVARAVRALSDVLDGDTPEKKAPWRERKTRFVAQLGRVDARTRLVAACDKLDNLSAIVADLETEGVATLERFSGSPRQIRWYYEEVSRALGNDIPRRLRKELDDRLDKLREFVHEASPER